MSSETKVYGLMAEFADHEYLVAAARASYTEGYRRMDAYSPFPVQDLPRAIGRRGTAIPLLVLLGGTIGGLGGYFMQAYAMAVDYPLNIGGRPLHSWPAFIPITFELTVLCASLTAFLSVFLLNKLPQPYHPVFNVPEFARASQDRFFLCIEAVDPKFDLDTTRRFLAKLHPEKVTEVVE
jgi:hypothetical protein